MVSQVEDTNHNQHGLESYHLKVDHDSPVFRLPPELLEPIIALAAGLDEHEKSILVVPYTHVCRSWRYIVISTPRLWRYLDVHLPDFMAECLLRSKSAPICISKYEGVEVIPSAWIDLWSFHTHRITEIVMDITNCLIDFQLFQDIPTTLPCLTVLALNNNFFSRIEGPIVVPFRSLPALRDLRLRCIYLQDDVWDLISGLTQLSFSNPDHFRATPSFQQVFGIIARSPMLRSIDLGGNIRSSGDFTSAPVLHLPYLAEVHIRKLPPPVTLHFLSKLYLPPACKLTLDLATNTSLASLLPPMTTNHLLISDHSLMEISDLDFKLYKVTDSNKESTIFSCRGSIIPQIFSSLGRVFELSKLTFLRVHTDRLISTTRWTLLFLQLPSLTSFEVIPPNPETLFLILGALVDVFVEGVPAVVCPLLRSLSLRILDVDVGFWKNRRAIRNVIVPWLHQRADIDAAIRELHLVGFGVPPRLLTTLQGLVKVLRIDDAVKGWEDSEVSDGEQEDF